MRRNARTFRWPAHLCAAPVLTSAECKLVEEGARLDRFITRTGAVKAVFDMVPHADVSDAILAIRVRVWNERATLPADLTIRKYSGKISPNKEWENRHDGGPRRRS